MHDDEIVVLPSGASPYLQKDKREYSIRTGLTKFSIGGLTQGMKLKISLELKLKEVIDNKIRRCNNKLQADRKSFVA